MGEQRVGQALFNALYAVRPDIADLIRGGDTDPFHDDKRLPAFMAEMGRLAQLGERTANAAKVRALGCSGSDPWKCESPWCPTHVIADMIEGNDE